MDFLSVNLISSKKSLGGVVAVPVSSHVLKNLPIVKGGRETVALSWGSPRINSRKTRPPPAPPDIVPVFPVQITLQTAGNEKEAGRDWGEAAEIRTQPPSSAARPEATISVAESRGF